MIYQKPFLKWVGGKTQILDKVFNRFPSKMKNYYEPFLGGGSVLFALLTLQNTNKIKISGSIFAFDFNPTLINLYKIIQTNPDELHKVLVKYFSTYGKLIVCDKSNAIRKPQSLEQALTSKEAYYYWCRDKFNTMDICLEKCALFWFLNKTNFRGMYREGPNGFNVPYGHYKKTPDLISIEDLRKISALIFNVKFECVDFRESLKNVNKGDFVYLDPPYAPENDKSFVGYVADGFNLDMHKALFSEIKKIGEKGAKFVMSNAKVDLVMETFKDYDSKCEDVVARRAINSKRPDSTAMEVLIYN